MAIIWIVTIGNSDIKLTSEHQWSYLRENKREALKPCYGDFQRPTEEPNGLWSLPARVLGMVYGGALETHWTYFKFPLLSAFTEEIKSDKKNKPDRIIVLLTDQTNIFLDTNPGSMYDRSDPDCPYWKDTCELKPILEKYFEDEFGKNKATFSTLEPTNINKGLDHWDETLHLVQQKFAEWKTSKRDRIIISHQAGTPAISSAVQLTALIEFGKKVQFLVSNEFIKDKAQFLSGSSYFSTLQIEEAQQLLERFDYGGVVRALEKIEFQDETKQGKLRRILELLELADLWNSAKFDEFAEKLGDSANSRSKTFWWKGYEMAYLAWVRMCQENPTEAFFHSVRAVEGLICEWAIDKHYQHIHYKFSKVDRNGHFILNQYGKKISEYQTQRFRASREGSPCAKDTIDQRFKQQLSPKEKDLLSRGELGLHGKTLYTLFRTTFQSPNTSNVDSYSIKIVWEEVADIRNELFHRLKGITKDEVYEAWGCENGDQWKKLLFDCVQLVSNTQNENFKSLKQGSLITPIHENLKTEIDNLLQPKEPV